jgi:hypothetical protein
LSSPSSFAACRLIESWLNPYLKATNAMKEAMKTSQVVGLVGT